MQQSPEKAGSRRSAVILLPILVGYIILSLYGIDQQSLWQDEFHSLERATSSLPFWRDGHGFLYFAALSLWLHLGDSELMLRSLSVVFGAAAVCLLYKLASALLGRQMAVIGTALFATSPYLIWYSQEARYVTLTIATTLLMMWAFYNIMVGRDSLARWLVYGGTALLAFFSFLATLLLPIVHGLQLLLFSNGRPLFRRWLLCQLIVFALFTGWFVNGTHFWQAYRGANTNAQTVSDNPKKLLPFSGDFNNIRPAVIPYTFFAFSTGFSLGPAPRELYADRTFAPLLPVAPMIAMLAALYGALLLSALSATYRHPNAGSFLLLWVTVPVLGAFGIAKLLDIFYDVRYVAMAFPAYVLLLSLGISTFRTRWVQFLLVSGILSVHGVSLANYYFDSRYSREDTRSAAKYLEASSGPQDLVLVLGTVSSLPHYYKGQLPLVVWSKLDGDQPLHQRVKDFSRSHERLWLVEIRPWEVDRAGNVKTMLDKTFIEVVQQQFPGVNVYGYELSK